MRGFSPMTSSREYAVAAGPLRGVGIPGIVSKCTGEVDWRADGEQSAALGICNTHDGVGIGSGIREFLDAEVARIRNEDVAAGVHGYVPGLIELPVAGTNRTPLGEKGPVGAEHLNAVVSPT